MPYIHCPNDPEKIFGEHTWMVTLNGGLGDPDTLHTCAVCGAALVQRNNPTFVCEEMTGD